MKRGQVTVFIVLGIIIVATILAGYYYKDQISEKVSSIGLVKTASVPPELEEKKAAIGSCVKGLLENAVVMVSSQGGYASVAPEGSLIFGFMPIAYYFDEGKSNVPTDKVIASEIASLVAVDAPKCAGFVEGASQPKKAAVTVKLADSKVTADVKMPVSVDLNGVASTMGDFSASVNLGLSKVISFADALVSQQVSDPKNVCLSCINDLAIANNVEVELEPYQGATVVTVIDRSSVAGGEPLRFAFAMRY